MRWERAEPFVLEYMGSEIAKDLDESQVKELTSRIAANFSDSVTYLSPHEVAKFATDLEEIKENAVKPGNGRVVPPRQQQPKQTREQINTEIAEYFNQDWWSQMAPGTIPAITPDAKIGSTINHAAFFGAVNARITRGEPINRDFLNVIVLNLFQRGLLEKPQPEVVPPPPPTERDLHNQQVARDRAMNQRDLSPIKGAKEKAQPLVKPTASVLTEEQRVALNTKKRIEDSTIAEAQRRISLYTAGSHSRTFSGKSELQQVFSQAMDEGLEAKDVLARVDQAIDRLAGNSSVR